MYGLWLTNGGSPDGFQDLTMDDVQLMYMVHQAEGVRNRKLIAESIAKIFGGGRLNG